jgi:hypothetical protein
MPTSDILEQQLMVNDLKRAERDIKREMREALRREPFAQGGLNQLVKVVSLFVYNEFEKNRKGRNEAFPVTKFVTLEKFLLGQTPEEIETSLGLKRDMLRSGCVVIGLQRQPGPSEVEYELTAEYPDGVAFTVLSHQDYLPGDKRIHQWRLRVTIPGVLLCVLSPGTRYGGRSVP